MLGTTWRVGTGGPVLRVRSARLPCRTLAGDWAVPDLVRRFVAAAEPGAYLSVERPGALSAGDAVRVLHVPAHGVTVRELFRAQTGDRALVAHVLTAGVDLPGDVLARLAGASAQRPPRRPLNDRLAAAAP